MRSLLDRPAARVMVAAAAVLALLVAVALAGAAVAARGLLARAHPTASRAAGPAGLDAYRGLATWVDLYDHRAWSDPSSAVSDMASHGVRTIFIETANSDSRSALVHPVALGRFIDEAHARRMYVVAWYLPDLHPGPLDYDRISEAIDFTSPGGGQFDSFALDIESTSVKPASARNAALTDLSEKIRSKVGTAYALGAIIPPPVGLKLKKKLWPGFPYAMLAAKYDVFLPMNYYTFDIRRAAPVYRATVANVRILRAQPGCLKARVHMIGGISGDSSVPQVREFVRAVNGTACFGASLYGWAGTTHAKWRALSGVTSRAPRQSR